MLLLSKLAQNWLPWREGHLGGPTGAPWAPRPGATALFRSLVQQRLAEVAAFAAAASRLAAPMHLLLLHHLLLQRHLLLQQLRLTESRLLPRSL